MLISFPRFKVPFEQPGPAVCYCVVFSFEQALRTVSVFDPRGNGVVVMERGSCPSFPSPPPPTSKPNQRTPRKRVCSQAIHFVAQSFIRSTITKTNECSAVTERQTFQIVFPLCQRIECGVCLPWLSWIAIIRIYVNRLSLYFSSKLIFFFFCVCLGLKRAHRKYFYRLFV